MDKLKQRTRLQQLLSEHFNRQELEDLYFSLGLESDELPNKAAMIRDMIARFQRHNRMGELVDALRAARPEVAWAEEEEVVVPPSLPHQGGGGFSTTSPALHQGEVFISYAWGGDSEAIVDKLDQALQARGLTIVRDKRDLGFKGSIQAFMERIGRGRYVVVVISEKYLKSENCMFELLAIAKQGAFSRRIFPIVLADADIYKPVQRLRYIKHWEDQISELDAAMKAVGGANLQGVRESLDLYTEIRAMLAGLTETLKDMNTLTPEIHENTRFEALYSALEQAMREDGVEWIQSLNL